MNIEEGNELISVRRTDGSQSIVIATRKGMAICFRESDIRVMGRAAGGVRGIMLEEGDYVIGAARARKGGTLLTITENGYGKRTPLEEYLRGSDENRQPQKRGGKGLVNYRLTEKTGYVAAVKVVDDNDDVIIITDDGTLIRMPANDINIYTRQTQGVRVMRVPEGSRVISAARLEHEETENNEDNE